MPPQTQNSTPLHQKIPVWMIVVLGLVFTGVGTWVLDQNFTKKQMIESDPSNWQTYRNDEYGVEFKHPWEWTHEDFGLFENEGVYFINPNLQIGENKGSPVFDILFVKNKDNIPAYDYASKEIKENNCPGADRIISSDQKGVLYVTSCGATSERYVYVTENPNNSDLVRLSYYDEFDSDWSEEQKLSQLKQIIYTLKFTSTPNSSEWQTFDSVKEGTWDSDIKFTFEYPKNWYEHTGCGGSKCATVAADFDMFKVYPPISPYCRVAIAFSISPQAEYENTYTDPKKAADCDRILNHIKKTLK